VQYELCYAIEDFSVAPQIQSDIVMRSVVELNRGGIPIGTEFTDIRVVSMPAGSSAKSASAASFATTTL
jgi:hypothetical protein